ncbi:MAG TPA: LysR family transcriptional regulator [Ramlibacter sp.]|nr:LysR family transcriptional regulator [Ramlibacter sp.]
MNPKNLQSFMKVVEFGTFNRAAAQLHITQPALSRRIGALEDEVKTKLFDRRGQGVTLTDAGVALRDHAEGLLRHLEQVRLEMVSRGSTPSGSLSVGLPAPFRSTLSSRLVPAFCLDYPQVKLHVFENTPHLILNMLLSGSLELGVISQEDPTPGLTCEPFVTEQLFIAGAPRHGFKLNRPVSATRLAEFPLVQAVRPSAVRTLLARFATERGLTFNYNVEVDSIHLMIDVAASGHSCTALPYSAIREQVRAGRICAAPLTHLSLEWAIARPMERQISVASRRFTEALRATARQEIDSGEWLTARYREG